MYAVEVTTNDQRSTKNGGRPSSLLGFPRLTMTGLASRTTSAGNGYHSEDILSGATGSLHAFCSLVSSEYSPSLFADGFPVGRGGAGDATNELGLPSRRRVFDASISIIYTNIFLFKFDLA